MKGGDLISHSVARQYSNYRSSSSGQSSTMRKFRLRIYLVALFLAIIPTATSYFAVRGVQSSTLTLGLDQRVETQLDLAGKNLKTLARFDPENESLYKNQFLQLQEVKRTYTFLLDTLPSIRRAYIISFIIALSMGLVSALALATWLNRKIIQSHELALQQMKHSQEQVFHLENRESWKLVAQKLVHEIKNPLTPIQVMVSRLPGKYLQSDPSGKEEFKQVLNETKQIVTEEIQKVNSWIEAFSKYARMPVPEISQVNLNEFLLDFQKSYTEHWDNLKISVNTEKFTNLSCSFDPLLIKQVFFNLAKNSAESAPKNDIRFSIEVQSFDETGVIVLIQDNGPGIPKEIRERLFQPNISSKGNDQPRGFGLAIVKKILIEHGGDIRHLDLPDGCGFEIRFSRIGSYEKS